MADWEAIAERMTDALSGNPKGRGWAALCPAHEDHDPSLEYEVKNGTLVFKCRAGCSQEAVLDALKDRGLWPEKGTQETATVEWTQTAAYRYIDPDSGEIIGTKERLEAVKGGKRVKRFVWKDPDGKIGLSGRTPPLYRGELLQNHSESIVIVVEGEKCVKAIENSIAHWGEGPEPVAICGPNGENTDWSLYATRLAGRKVVIIPDNDDPGYRYMGAALKHIKPLAQSVTLVELPDLPAKGDVYDWMAAGHTMSDLRAVIERAPITGEAPAVTTKPNGKLPHNIEAERAILGAVLLAQGEAFEAANLEAELFYVPAHQIIWRAFVDLYADEKPLGAVTVKDYLSTRHLLGKVGGAEYIDKLASPGETPYADFTSEFADPIRRIAEYAALVRRTAVQRKLIGASESISKIGWNGTLDTDDALQAAWNEIDAVSGVGVTGAWETMSEILPRVETQMDEAAAAQGKLTGLGTGLIDIDRLTNGLQRGDLIVVAGRPAMGKSGFGLNVVHTVAVEQKLPVAIFSLEMSAEQLAQRLVGLDAKVSIGVMRTGRGSAEDAAKVRASINRLMQSQIYIDDSPGTSIMSFAAKVKRLHREVGGLGLVLVDYLGLMIQGQPNVVQELSAISRKLKGVARELDVPVMALSQLSRKCEERQDKRPMLSDLRDSGSIEQDADVVMLLYRDEYYNKDTEDRGIAEVDLAKHRNGPTGKVSLYFVEEQVRFENLETGYELGSTVIPQWLEDNHDMNEFAQLSYYEMKANGAMTQAEYAQHMREA